MTDIFEVVKWSHPTPLADGTCHCGQPIKYDRAQAAAEKLGLDNVKVGLEAARDSLAAGSRRGCR